jgi:hypothetical protein
MPTSWGRTGPRSGDRPAAVRDGPEVDLPRLLGYLGTWSSAQRYQTQVGSNPLDLIRTDMGSAWDDPDQVREVVWALHLRVGMGAMAQRQGWIP